ncbi:sulfotransferase [Lolliginicoccus suaedae]|uniref:sulfotransferase n=1 Tax=Lolliginicoccus suaedae TaxID=2605429 RepID=UPI0011F07729|nr:sulfotransferase [Lolliginicoccus suaedae]
MTVVYLHIGTDKTGTTAIQEALSKSTRILRAHGILYPRTGRIGHAHYLLSSALGFTSPPEQSTAAIRARIPALQKRLANEIRRSRADAVIISSEMFVNEQDVALARELLAPFDTRIIVYLRRHDKWWESAYRESVKRLPSPPWESSAGSFIDFHQRRNSMRARYRHLITRWADQFGTEALIVRPFEKQQNQPDIVTDFLRAADQPELAESGLIQPPLANLALDNQTMSLIDIYQRSRVPPRIRRKLITHAMDAPLGTAHSPTLSPARRRQLIADNAEDYEWIARTFLGRTDGKLFLDPPPRDDDAWAEPGPPDPRIVAEHTMSALTEPRFTRKNASRLGRGAYYRIRMAGR